MSFSASINEIVSHGLRTPADPSVYVCSEFLLLYMVHTNAGAYFGDSTQLLYLRARQYSPNIGRFLTRDKWTGDQTSPDSYNYWLYASDNPIMFTDPSGMCHNCIVADFVSVDARPTGIIGVRKDPNSLELIGYIHDRAIVQVDSLKYGSGLDAFRKITFVEDPETGKTMTGWVKNIRLLDNCKEGGFFGCLPIRSDTWTQTYGFGPNSFAESVCAHDRSQCPYELLRGLHNGLDFSAAEGSELIWAGSSDAEFIAAPGDAEPNIAFRYRGYTIIYGHVSRNLLADQELGYGYKIRPGQAIGLSGSDHLHVGVRQGSTFVNPLYYFGHSLQETIMSRNMQPYPSPLTPYTMFAFTRVDYRGEAYSWFWNGCDYEGITFEWEIGG